MLNLLEQNILSLRVSKQIVKFNWELWPLNNRIILCVVFLNPIKSHSIVNVFHSLLIKQVMKSFNIVSKIELTNLYSFSRLTSFSSASLGSSNSILSLRSLSSHLFWCNHAIFLCIVFKLSHFSYFRMKSMLNRIIYTELCWIQKFLVRVYSFNQASSLSIFINASKPFFIGICHLTFSLLFYRLDLLKVNVGGWRRFLDTLKDVTSPIDLWLRGSRYSLLHSLLRNFVHTFIAPFISSIDVFQTSIECVNHLETRCKEGIALIWNGDQVLILGSLLIDHRISILGAQSMLVCENLWAKIIVTIFDHILFFQQLLRRVRSLRYWNAAIAHNWARVHAWASTIHHFSLCLMLQFWFGTFLVEFRVVDVLSSILVDKISLFNLVFKVVWAWRHGNFVYSTVLHFERLTLRLFLFFVLIRFELVRRLLLNRLVQRWFYWLWKSTYSPSWQLWFVYVVIWGLIF